MKHLHKFTHTFFSNIITAAASQNYTQPTTSDTSIPDNKFQISKTYKQLLKTSIWMGGILTILLPVSGELLGQNSLNSALVVNTLADRSIDYLEEAYLEAGVTCSNVTSGGTIGSSQTISSGGTPATFTNMTSPSGGTGTVEYLWLKTTTVPCPPIGDAAWESIPSSNTATYSPGPLTQTTCFMRCSRRAGCANYDGESNAVTVTVNTCTATLTGLVFDNQVGGSDISFTNGGTYTTTQLGSNFLIEALTSGTPGSVVFTVTGAESFTNTENSAPYHMVGSGSTWTPQAGSYSVNVKLYSGANGSGTLCGQQTFTFSVTSSSGCSCPGNLVQNPSFENGTTSWNWTGGNFYADTYAAQCGSNSGQFQITNGGNNWVSQTIAGGSLATIPVGTNLSVTVFAGTHNPGGYYHEVNISYYNSSWGYISKTSAEVNATLPSMGSYTLNSVVPAGTHYITVGGYGTGDWLKMDLWCVSIPCSINITSNPQGASICSGGTHTMTVAATTTAGTLNYQWQSSPNGSTWTNISGATSSSYTTPALTTTTHYRVNVGATGSGCSTISSSTAIVTVSADPQISIISWKSELCVSESTTLEATKSGGVNCSAVQWQYRPGTTGAWINLGTGNSINTSTSLAAGDYQYRALYNCSGTGCDNAISNTVTITIYADPVVSISANTTTVCAGGSATLTAVASGGGTCAAVLWQYRLGTTGTWTNLTSGNTLTTSTSLAVGTHQYRAYYNCVDAGGCGTATSNTVTFTVVADPSISTHPAGTTLCVSGTHTLSVVAAGGTPSLTYQWQSSPDGTTWTNISGATGTSYTTPTISTTTQYRVVVSASGSGCGTVNSNAAIVTINPAATVNAGPDQSVCAGNTVTLAGTRGGAATSSTWTTSGTGTFSNASLVNAVYTPSAADIAAGTVTLTLTTNDPTGPCTAVSDQVIITIRPNPTVNAGADASVCLGSSKTLTAVASGGTSPYAYAWSNGLGAGASKTVTPSITTTYTVTATDNYGCSGSDQVT
ncbi:MAG: hypothetical protein HUU01_17830, partial [Saprospiraceae bacterium]|nr:hypothetical protein [Saprospiraceae bacterium]